MTIKDNGLIGVQTMMLAEEIEKRGVYDTLAKVAEIGYHSIEISQLPMTAENISEIRRACKKLGIVVAAGSASLEPMMSGMPGEYLVSDFDKIVSDCKALDTKLLRIGMLPVPAMASKEKALDFAKHMDEMALRLQEHGIELYYHNHHVEFIRYDGVYLLDMLRDETKHIGFELDIHWIQRGGENPLTYIPTFAGRIRLLHLKDYRIGTFVPPTEQSMEAFFQNFNNVVEFAEVGEGSLPISQIIHAAHGAGSEHFLVEQDILYGRTAFDCLTTSRNNLIAMGFEGWF